MIARRFAPLPGLGSSLRRPGFGLPRFGFGLPIAVGLLALAGCGSPSSSGSPSTGNSTSAVIPTPTAAPTLPPVTPATIVGGSTAAVVNGHTVPMSQFSFLYHVNQHRAASQPGVTKQALYQQTMNDVILDELIREYATSHHLSVTPAEVKDLIRRDELQSGGMKAFTRTLAEYGLTIASYKRLVEPALLAQKVENAVAPLRTGSQPVAHVRHILIATTLQGKQLHTDAQARALAEKVLNKLTHGGNFAALARRYSDDTGSAQSGGDLGNVYPGQTVPPFDRASFTLPLHRYAIVHSVYGYHVMEVLSRGRAAMPAQQQQQDQQQRFQAWLSRQMASAKITKLGRVK